MDIETEIHAICDGVILIQSAQKAETAARALDHQSLKRALQRLTDEMQELARRIDGVTVQLGVVEGAANDARAIGLRVEDELVLLRDAVISDQAAPVSVRRERQTSPPPSQRARDTLPIANDEGHGHAE